MTTISQRYRWIDGYTDGQLALAIPRSARLRAVKSKKSRFWILKTYIFQQCLQATNLVESVTVLTPAHSPAWLEVGADSLASSLVKLDKLAIARLQYRLDLVLGLLRYRHQTIQVLVHKQSNKQLEKQTAKYAYVYSVVVFVLFAFCW